MSARKRTSEKKPENVTALTRRRRAMARPLRVTAVIEPASHDPAHRAAWRRMWHMMYEKALPYVLEYRAQQEASEAA